MMLKRTRLVASLLALCLVLVVTACGRNRNEDASAAVEPTATVAEAAPAEGNTDTESEAATEGEADAASDTETDANTEAEADAESAPATADGDPLSVVNNAMVAMTSGGPYRATTTVDADGTVTEMVAEVIPPDTMHVTIGGGNMEMIMVEGTVWSRSGETPWAQMGGTQMMQGILDSIRGQVNDDNLLDVQQVGSEPVFGVQTDVYTFSSVVGEGEGAVTSEVKLWVAQDSGLPVRMESSSVANGITTTAIQTIEYDPAITIEAPTP